MFGATFLIAPEIVPVVVYFFGTSFLPATCVTPMFLDNRRRRRMDDLDRKNLPVTPRVTPTIEQVKELPRRTLIHECRYDSLSELSNVRILGVFARRAPLYLFPTAYLRERLIRRVNYLEYDDELIRNAAKPDLKDMSLEEVKLALEERGVYVPYTILLILDLCTTLCPKTWTSLELHRSHHRICTSCSCTG